MRRVDGRVLKLCRAESCQAMGCEELVAHLAVRHGVTVDGLDEGSADLASRSVYCLGNCALSPAALLDGEPIGRLDRDRLDAIVAGAEREDAMNARVFVPARFFGAFGRRGRRRRRARSMRRAAAASISTIVRTGSRGLFWLEPLIEVETAAGRIGYGPVAPDEVARRCSRPASWLAASHPKALGRVEDIPFLARQQRLIFARCGLTDPLSIDDYRRHGGLTGP